MEIKGTPVKDNGMMGQYSHSGAAVGESGALCQQTAQMQHTLNRLLSKTEDVQDTLTQVLDAMQAQTQRLSAVMDRIDRTNEAVIESMNLMKDSAQEMNLNSKMIVEATLTAAYSVADEETAARARIKARHEVKQWQMELRRLSKIA